MTSVALIFWIIVFILHAGYKLAFQYKSVGHKPHLYSIMKTILNYLERVTLLITVWLMITSDNNLYLLLILISLGGRYLINFICFKRESDKLHKTYIEGGIDHRDALETANDTVNRKIKNKEIF